MGEAAAGGETALAEGARNVGALVSARVEMLPTRRQQDLRIDVCTGTWIMDTHHPETVCIVKFALARFAVMLPVPLCVHMTGCSCPTGEAAIARLTFK